MLVLPGSNCGRSSKGASCLPCQNVGLMYRRTSKATETTCGGPTHSGTPYAHTSMMPCPLPPIEAAVMYCTLQLQSQ